jgi:hypothetical protein
MGSEFQFAVALIVLAASLGWAFAPFFLLRKSEAPRESANES